jgi:hypothetical protein
MKTIDNYMNDPRLLEEPETDEPIKKIHAARLMLHDETAGMSDEEKIVFINAKGKASLARLGLSPKFVNFSGRGKLKPRQPTIQ